MIMRENTEAEKKSQLSPSAAARWIACPGSEYIIPLLPRLPSSESAQEGTLAHEFAAHAAATVLQEVTGHPGYGSDHVNEPEAALATMDITEGAQVYADAICAQCGKSFSGDFVWAVEMPVTLDDLTGCRLRGRLDFAAWDDETIVVADYKFGGEFVPAAGNPQLFCYAMCVANDWLHKHREGFPKRVIIGIIQPRTEIADFSYGASWASYEWDDFYEEAKKIRAAAQEATSADAKTLRKPGKHCRWCAARSVCRAAIGERLLLAAIVAGEAEMATDATDEQIGVWLDALRGMDTVREDLTRIAKARIAAGATVPGWRIQSRKGKDWGPGIRGAGDVREQAGALALAIGGSPEDYITESLKTPAIVGKSVPKEALAPVIVETVSSALVSAFGGKK